MLAARGRSGAEPQQQPVMVKLRVRPPSGGGASEQSEQQQRKRIADLEAQVGGACVCGEAIGVCVGA